MFTRGIQRVWCLSPLHILLLFPVSPSATWWYSRSRVVRDEKSMRWQSNALWSDLWLSMNPSFKHVQHWMAKNSHLLLVIYFMRACLILGKPKFTNGSWCGYGPKPVAPFCSHQNLAGPGNGCSPRPNLWKIIGFNLGYIAVDTVCWLLS